MEKKDINNTKPWLPHYEKGVHEDIDFEEICFPEILDRTAENYPDKTAFIFQGFKISYKDFNTLVNHFATTLHGFGVKKGDSVSILLPNIIPCAAAFYAINRIGGIAVMNNPLYSDRELRHQFNDSSSKVLITLDLLVERMVNLRPYTGIKQIVYTSIGDYLPFPKKLLFSVFGKRKGLSTKVTPEKNLFKWKDLIKKYPPTPPKVDVSINDTALYQYTGGTTGVSKGAVLTHKNISFQVQQINGWIPDYKNGEEIMLGAMPFFHVFGLSASMNLSVYKGWTNILVPKPQTEELMESISKYRATLTPLVPTMFIGLLNHPDIEKVNLNSIKACFSGSSPLPIEVIKDFEQKTGSIIIEGFGMTESSPLSTCNPLNKDKRKAGSVGIPIPSTQIKIVDLENSELELPAGKEGEILIKGPQVMKCYHEMKDETEDTIKNGWLHSGDVGFMDEDGYLFIVDRIKDMIISGGYNVYPRDIDEVVFEHPKVLEACSLGIPHESRGEQIKVYVVLTEGETATPEEIIDFCKGKLATYKLPTVIEFINELPKSNVGKVLRKDLRSQ